MKKLFWYILIMNLLIYNFSFSQGYLEEHANLFKNDETNLSGKIKSIRDSVFMFKEKFGEVVEVSVGENRIVEYDNKGNINKKISLGVIYYYKGDQNDNIIQETMYGYNQYSGEREELKRKIFYKYSEDGKRTEMKLYGGYHGNLKITETYEYDSKGNLIKTIIKSSESKPPGYITYNYDNNGNVTKESRYYWSLDNPPRQITYFYDNNHSVIERNIYYSNGQSKKRTFKYVYDNKGNWISKIIYDQYGNPYRSIKRQIDYYE